MQLPLSSDDRSFYLDQPVFHPEALSGIWETSNGQGGAVGIHLALATTLPGDDDHVAWTPQAWQHLEVDVFERKGAERGFGDANGFSDSQRGGTVLFKDGRLELHYVSHWQDATSIDLDLVLQADSCWRGRFHRGKFDRVVSLCRPTPGANVRRNPLVGTWFASGPERCVHIAQTGADTFEGWSDSLMIPGRIRFAPTIPGPHKMYEYYGSLVKVELAGNGYISVEFGAYSGICCPHTFLGKVSADGSSLEGHFPGPNLAPYAPKFAKMRGDSCVERSAQ
ncbi:MAG: hypothetical protein WA510_01525 [Acidobacteriaceae bacterium]